MKGICRTHSNILIVSISTESKHQQQQMDIMMTMTNNENSPDSLEFGVGVGGSGEHVATPADLQTLNNHNFLIALGGVAAARGGGNPAAPHFAMPVSVLYSIVIR